MTTDHNMPARVEEILLSGAASITADTGASPGDHQREPRTPAKTRHHLHTRHGTSSEKCKQVTKLGVSAPSPRPTTTPPSDQSRLIFLRKCHQTLDSEPLREESERAEGEIQSAARGSRRGDIRFPLKTRPPGQTTPPSPALGMMNVDKDTDLNMTMPLYTTLSRVFKVIRPACG